MPFFQKLIAEQADALPITDARMTRFWITLTQGVNLVLSSMELMEGGEIFVPKIPSMSTTELARSMAPTMPQKIIGIRPGEKLHEIMISADDARQTLELDDRYVILPSFFAIQRDTYIAHGAKPVREGFAYSSDANSERLDARALQAMLADSFA
jgi:UDP-N-acetylglucosamine 4,6-dehydratase